jgi:hypothetical protein
MIPPLMSWITFLISMIASLEEIRSFQQCCSFIDLDRRSHRDPKDTSIGCNDNRDYILCPLLEIKAT